MYPRTSSTISANPLAATGGQNHRVSPNHVGYGKKFRRLEVSQSIDGQVLEDKACRSCLTDFLKSSQEVSRCASAHFAQRSFLGAVTAAIVAAFDQLGCSFKRGRFELSYVLLNESPKAAVWIFRSDVRKGNGVEGEAEAMRS